jgi:hypothetical protein
LEKNDFAELRNIKKMFNYDLISMQEIRELEQDIQTEFVQDKLYPSSLVAMLRRQAENKRKYAYLISKKRKETQQKVVANKGKKI